VTNPVAVIGLTFSGTDLQTADFGVFLEILRGLNERPAARGVDLVVPSRAGRIVRNRVGDTLTIELRGYVMGTGTPATAAETVGGVDTTLAADAVAGALAIVLTSAAGIADNQYLRIGDTGETEIRRVDPSWTAGTTIPLTAPLIRNHDAGDQVRQVDTAGSSGDREVFRTNAKIVRALFATDAEPADLIAALEDGTTATIAARALNSIWDQITPDLAAVSIELESVAPDWSIA
jgi:hypothetical protein